MKKLALLLLIPVPFLAACTENHYYTVKPATTERTYVKPVSKPRKSAPSVSSESAEEFRAVEKPGTYSQ